MRAAVVALVLLGSSSPGHADAMSMTFGTPKVAAVEVKPIAAVMSRNRDALRACYPAPVDRAPEAQVIATLTFTIGRDGRVREVSTVGLGDDANACITKAVTRLTFRKPTAGRPVSVTYPLVYELVHPAAAAGVLGSASLMEGGAFASLTDPSIASTARDQASVPGMPTIEIGQPTTKGALGAAIIRRYLKRNGPKLLFCYEKELLRDPDLVGQVTAEFTIGTNGTVTAATAKGMNSPDVESCVAGQIERIEFPTPKTGEVTVRLPVTFHRVPNNH